MLPLFLFWNSFHFRTGADSSGPFCMVTFYSTSFDSITLVAAAYSYKELKPNEEPNRNIKLFWSIMLILLPIALIFSENSMANLQTVSIIAAFPLGIIIILILGSFFKDADAYLKEKQNEKTL